MATNTREVIAFIATLMAGSDVAQSSSLTATILMTGAHRFRVPFAVRFSNVSADPIISLYPSSDNGNGFDTDAMVSIPIGRIASGTGQRSVELKSGIYAVQLLNSGPNTATFFILTQEVMTAYETT